MSVHFSVESMSGLMRVESALFHWSTAVIVSGMRHAVATLLVGVVMIALVSAHGVSCIMDERVTHVLDAVWQRLSCATIPPAVRSLKFIGAITLPHDASILFELVQRL